MEFIINMDTGNIEQDVLNTIINFSDGQLERFIDSIKLEKACDSVHDNLIYFRYADYHDDLDAVDNNDNYKNTTELQRFFNLSLKDLIELINNSINFDDIEYMEKLKRVTSKIKIREWFINTLVNDKYDAHFYSICFTILSSIDMFDNFLNYSENTEIFGEEFTQEDYVFELSKILGNKTDEICENNPIYNYPIVNKKMLRKYLKLRKIVNVDVKMLGRDLFGKGAYSLTEQKQIDDSWQVNQELLDYIMDDMEPGCSLLYKICHIYIRACYALRYNSKYKVYKYGTYYIKERQEGISLKDNEVICSEFAKVCTNIYNKLDSRLEARCIANDNLDHESFGIVIREMNIRIDFDAIKLIGSFSDLDRVKLGLPLEGIKYICDRNKEFIKAYLRAYDDFLSKQKIETNELLSAYEKTATLTQVSIDFNENLSEFVKRMNEKRIIGSELLNSFIYLNHLGYFGETKCALVGEDRKFTFADRRKMTSLTEILNGLEENIIINNKENYYLLRLDDCKVHRMNQKELNELFNNDKMYYINDKYTIEGIGNMK